MHAKQLSHILAPLSSAVSHAKRWTALMEITSSLLDGEVLSVTGLGRTMRCRTHVKHKIKKVDRLLNNQLLQKERLALYRAQAKVLLASRTKIEIIVDWSPCGERRYQFLRASLVASGRALTLYEEVHPETEMQTKKVEHQFLMTLSSIIPKECEVTIITDAGFRTPWFQKVSSLGWDYIGRVRGNAHYKKPNISWKTVCSLHQTANRQIQRIDNVSLTKTNPTSCFLFIVKRSSKNRMAKNKNGSRNLDDHSTRHARAANEPWVIASSLTCKRHVIKAYEKRMQIELAFRDTKSTRYGLSLNQHQSKSIKRLSILLLIASLAIFVLWLIGKIAENKKLHFHFQANTIKNRRVLSYVFLGRQILRHAMNQITLYEIKRYLKPYNIEGVLL